jgi:glycosyltransferase involved in cell wall biosynthesis
MKRKLICVHIGARAHYLLPKALQSQDNLEALITDTWVSSKLLRTLLSNFPVRIIKSFSSRYSPLLPSKKVYSFSWRFFFAEIFIRFKYKDTWQQILKRNFLFEHIAAKIFKRLSSQHDVLGISYTSLNIFQIAKGREQKTVLFQIDPGYKEEQIVADLLEKNKDKFATTWKRAPESYWADWKKECGLSDVIMVNSEWSKDALMGEGIDERKIKILPLPFPLESKHFQYEKKYTEVFNQERPLKLLFLGTLTLRKGIHLVIEAASKLIEYPIEFILVGHNELNASVLELPNVQYKGVVSRSETDILYQSADAFLFPTFSDGFGLTQLEALSWNVPVIASKYCGRVVIKDFNGIILPECNSEELITAILMCLKNPAYLKQLSLNGIKTVEKFTVEEFARGIANLVE